MSSFTTTTSTTFTVTHARRIASKVATDLRRLSRFYGTPSLETISEYEEELVELLKYDAIDEVTYGYKEDGEWVTAVKYKSVDGTLVEDSTPGQLRAGFDVSGAYFTSFLSYSWKWFDLSQSDRDTIKEGLAIQRSTGTEPGIKNGYWTRDIDYSAGGRGLERSRIQSY